MALHEEQLEALGERLVPLFQEFESGVIADIVRRLKKTGTLTESAEQMARSLRDKGFSPAAIHRQVMKAIRADKALQKAIEENTIAAKSAILKQIEALRARAGPEIQSAVEEAGNTAFNNDLSQWKGKGKPVKGSAFEQLIKAMQTRADDEILNLTKSLGFRFPSGHMVHYQQAYSHSLNVALTKISTGAYSYQQALEEAVRDLARSGVRVVNFESGVTRQADTAVRNAMLTTSSQLAGQITMQNMAEADTNLVEVSKHWGARTGKGHGNHAAWQGGIYCVEGSDENHRNLQEATGYPGDPRGLHGYNCRHSFYPFWEGISQPTQWPDEPPPVEINGKKYTYYEITQAQRRMEREIRAMKREEFGLREAGMNAKADAARGRYRGMIREYNEFSAAAGVSPKRARLRIATISK